MKVTVCIPMYNEEAIAADCARTLCASMDKGLVPCGDEYEIIFCDDGSRDSCGDRVREVAALCPQIRVIGYSDNRGKGSAVREAVLASVGDIVLYTDCDLAYGTDVILDAVDRMKKNRYDVLIGSRNLTDDGYDGYNFIRRVASKTYIKVLNICAGFKLSDSQCGFKVFRGDAARKIFSYCESNGFAFDIEALTIAGKLGMIIGEMPVKIVNHRESKINILRDTVKMLKDLRIIKKRVNKIKFN